MLAHRQEITLLVLFHDLRRKKKEELFYPPVTEAVCCVAKKDLSENVCKMLSSCERLTRYAACEATLFLSVIISHNHLIN